ESAFDILPFYIKDSKNSDTLKSCIEEIRAVYFPLQSTELVVGSSSYHITFLPLKNDFLFEFLSVFFCKEPNHALEENFQRSVKEMIKSTAPCNHQKFADIIFKMLLPNHQNYTPDTILALIDKVLLVIFAKY
ncbi:DNA-dependent protein kinase catalytic subunit, partial [Trichonephila clavata]